MVLGRRDELSAILGDISTVSKVYFQPNENTKLVYPCITYSRDPTYHQAADNTKYLVKDRYQITLIDRAPENPAFDVLLDLPYSSHVASFVADGLNHHVFDLYH